MSNEYGFSAKTKCFYPLSLFDIYKKKGTLPDDIVYVDETVFKEFTDFSGVVNRAVGSDDSGYPTWVNT